MDFYNNKIHSVTKQKPADVFINGLRPRIRSQKLSKRDDVPQFKLGDQVRTRVDKSSSKIVKKSMTNNWSDDIFTVHEVDDKQSPILYKLIDKNNKILKRKYYHFELIDA